MKADLNIAEIPYESGGLKFRYARIWPTMAGGGYATECFSSTMKMECWHPKGITSMGPSMASGATTTTTGNWPPRANMIMVESWVTGNIGMPTESSPSRAD